MAKKLDAKECRFRDEYLVDLDPQRAAIEAGYSETTAKSKAYQWVSNRKVKPHLFDAIQAAKARREKRTEITQDRVLQEIAKIGFADIRKAVAWGGKPTFGEDGEFVYPVELVPSSEVDDDTAAAITEVSLTAQGVKIKMADKRAALETLLKHTSGLPDDDAPQLNITITAKDPVGDVRVTRSDS